MATGASRTFSAMAATAGLKTRAVPAAVLKASLSLPATTFPMRANAAVRELQHVERLTTNLYRRQRQRSQEKDAPAPFTLHDGPPYANGALHIGHFMNKVLKDVIVRRQLLSGRAVNYVPGWDCHGLPIEHKALQAMRASTGKGKEGAHTAEPAAMAPLEVRQLARTFAMEAIRGQCRDFQRWGVLADWDVDARASTGSVYITMDAEYEARQLRVFRKLVEAGYVHRSLKPVYWSPSSATALAEAELEYVSDYVSQAAYVTFPLLPDASAASRALAAVVAAAGARTVSAVVWTTTPWTLPANVALAVHRDVEYVLVRQQQQPANEGGVVANHLELLLVARDRVADLQRVLGGSSRGSGVIVDGSSVFGRDLLGACFLHPMCDELPRVPALDYGPPFPAAAAGAATAHLRSAVVIAADYVTADSGTGIVHTAPGHGHDDYAACMAYNAALDAAAAPAAGSSPLSSPPAAPAAALPVLCPVDGAGAFTAEAGAALRGLAVLGAGGAAVLASLASSGRLLRAEPHAHRYPHDWRTRKPVLIRATHQWFVRLGGGGLLDRCKAALAGVACTPAAARTRFEATVGSRAEWCISRQRAWGVPIPCLFELGGSGGDGGSAGAGGKAVLTPELVEHVAGVFAREGGSDAWWRLPVQAFVPPAMAAAAAAEAAATGRRPRTWVKGSDTLDVWFDSGTSWAAAWAHLDGGDGAGVGAPATCGGGCGLGGRVADVVLEGSDQHRGWFQSALITAVAATGAPPYRALVTHGFALDAAGRKMSKSVGNVVAPGDVIDGRGGGGGGGDRKGGDAAAPAGKKKDGASSGGRGGAGGAFGAALGVDVLRYWVASSDYTRDVAIGPAIVASVAEHARKIRNTLRFLLGNVDIRGRAAAAAAAGGSAAPAVDDAAVGGDAVAAQCLAAWSAPPLHVEPPALLADGDLGEAAEEQAASGGVGGVRLGLLDRCMLHRTAQFAAAVDEAYARHSFGAVAAAVNAFVAADLSACYLDFCKDRLYTDLPAPPPPLIAQGAAAQGRGQGGAAAEWQRLQPLQLGRRRAAAHLVLWETLRQLVRALAPLTPFTAEEAFQHSAAPLAAAAAAAAAGDASAAGAQPPTRPPVTRSADVVVPSATVFDVAFGAQAGSAAGVRQWAHPALDRAWHAALELRGEVNRCLERARAAGRIGSALEARVTLTVARGGGAAARLLRRLRADGELEDLLLVSHVQLLEVESVPDEAAPEAALAVAPAGGGSCAAFDICAVAQLSFGGGSHVGSSAADGAAPAPVAERVGIRVQPAEGAKCGRCWKLRPEVAAHPSRICHRCATVVDIMFPASLPVGQ